mmetsp:Transcript_82871/g.221444  ORF Transcript_82871/g.221444 Transcript_82871/m.221444 type:complete len:258 (+) Transcript_82871:435-1208(+)
MARCSGGNARKRPSAPVSVVATRGSGTQVAGVVARPASPAAPAGVSLWTEGRSRARAAGAVCGTGRGAAWEPRASSAGVRDAVAAVDDVPAVLRVSPPAPRSSVLIVSPAVLPFVFFATFPRPTSPLPVSAGDVVRRRASSNDRRRLTVFSSGGLAVFFDSPAGFVVVVGLVAGLRRKRLLSGMSEGHSRSDRERAPPPEALSARKAAFTVSPVSKPTSRPMTSNPVENSDRHISPVRLKSINLNARASVPFTCVNA